MSPNHWLYTIPLRLRSLVRRERVEAELDEELAYHLQSRTAELMAQGLAPEEAHRRALRAMEGIEQQKESCRDTRKVAFLEDFAQDVRYALRMLRKNPGFTAVAVLTLALGIGANSAIFSLVDGILLRPLPYPHPEELVEATGSYPRGAFVAVRDQAQTMSVAAYAEGHNFNLTGEGEPVRIAGTMVSAEFFSVLGARPKLGRAFLPGEDIAGRDNLVILGDALWRERFAGDPRVVGRSITLEGVDRVVAGVMGPEFHYPSTRTEVWIPLHLDSKNIPAYWAGDFMPVMGRLRPGTSMEKAQAEIAVIQTRLAGLFPWPMPANWNAGASVTPLQAGMVRDVRARLLLLLGAVGLVLLIACANVANLTLSRAATREKEMAIRAGLGAGRARMVRQLLAESVVLASSGALLGMLLASRGLAALKSLLPQDMPRIDEAGIDGRVLAFTAALGVLTGVVFGLFPALEASRAAIAESLKSGGRGMAAGVSGRLRNSLAIAEVGLSVMLVIGAGLLMRSFWTLSHADPGFQPERVLTARISPNQAFCEQKARCVSFYHTVLARLAEMPGVRQAALVNTLPLAGRVNKRSLELEGYRGPAGELLPLFWLNVVTPDYFRVMNISVKSGRPFEAADLMENSNVALVTEETAKTFWPGQNALGKHVRFANDHQWREIVGIVADVTAYDLGKSAPAWIEGTVYVPYNQGATSEDGTVPAEMTVALGTTAEGRDLEAMLRALVRSLGSEASVGEVQTMGAVLRTRAAAPRSTTVLFGLFAGVALALALLGVYGVLSFLVSRRSREIGIRMAMGARRSDVLKLVLLEGLKYSVAGTALGLAGSFLLSRLLASELYGTSTIDPVTFLGVPALVCLVTMLACYLPARRATRVDPMVTLRFE